MPQHILIQNESSAKREARGAQERWSAEDAEQEEEEDEKKMCVLH